MDENAPQAKAALSLLPSEYYKRQIYATTWFEQRNLAALIESVGEGNIMFETDFPHPTCLYRDPLKTAAHNMRDLSTEEHRKVLGENADVSPDVVIGSGWKTRPLTEALRRRSRTATTAFDVASTRTFQLPSGFLVSVGTSHTTYTRPTSPFPTASISARMRRAAVASGACATCR